MKRLLWCGVRTIAIPGMLAAQLDQHLRMFSGMDSPSSVFTTENGGNIRTTIQAAEIYTHATADHGRRIAELMDEITQESSQVRQIGRQARGPRCIQLLSYIA